MRYQLKHTWLGYMCDLNNIGATTFLKEDAPYFSISSIEAFLDSRPHARHHYKLVGGAE